MSKVIYGQVKLKATLPSGTGDDLLTRDSTSTQVGVIPGSITSLPNSQIFVGNVSNIPIAVAMSGDITISNTGVTAIGTGVIVNADVNASAAIAVSKLAALTASRVVVTDGSGFLTVATTTATEIGFVNGVTSAIQTQLNAKQATITGGATTIVSADLTANRALASNGSGKVVISTTTATELGYVNGVTSAIQTQIDGKLSVTLTTPADGDTIIRSSGSFVNLPIGTVGQVYTVGSGGEPEWAAGTSNGLPAGGTTGQYLNKINGTEYNTQWSTLVTASITDISASAAQINVLASGFYDASSSVQTQLNNKLSTTLTANNFWVGSGGNVATETTDLPTGTTLGGATIYRVGGSDVTLADGGTGASLADPGADRIMFWDDSAGAVTWLAPNNGLTVATTDLNLGGTLNANVIFNGAGFDFEVGQSGNRVDDFRVSATNFIALNASSAGITLTSGAQSFSLGTSTPPTISSARQGSSWIGDWTATANDQYHILLAGGTYTARATASDNIFGVQVRPTLVAAANDQRLAVLDLSATFTLGAFTGVRSNLIYSPNFAVQSTGQISMGSTASPPTIGPVANSGGTDATGSGVKVEGFLVGTTQTTAVFLGLVNNSLAINSTATGNVVQILMPSGGFAPSSGAYNLRQLYNAPTYNQTGTSSGNVIFCEYSPQETSIQGIHYGLLINSATARSAFGLITNPTATLQVRGSNNNVAFLVEDDAGNDILSLGESGGNRVIGLFGATPVVQLTSGANLTNNVTAGGTNDTIDNITDLSDYATDAPAIRNAIYQLARKLKQINDGLRLRGDFN